MPGCNCRGNAPKKRGQKNSCGYTNAVVEIDNPSQITLLRKVIIPSSMGDENDFPASVGQFQNVILYYELNRHVYIYSSDGIPTFLETEIPKEILDRIDNLEEDVKDINKELDDETTARIAEDERLQHEIDNIQDSPNVADVVETYSDLLEYDTSTLSDDDIIVVLYDETKNDATSYYRWGEGSEQWSFVAGVGPYYTKSETDSMMSGEEDARIAADQVLQDNIDAEASARQDADEALTDDLTAETSAREDADDVLQGNIEAEASAREDADTALQNNIDEEASTRAEADAGLSGDIIEEANIRAAADARIDEAWQEEATARGNADANLQTQINGKQNTLTAGDNIHINNDVISAVDTTYTAGSGLNLNSTEFSVDTSTIQPKLTAGSNINISNNNTISAIDTTYSAGSGINLTGTTFSVDTTTIQPKLTAGDNISITDNTISAVDTKYTAGSGMTLTGTSFSVDTSTIATQSDLSGETTARENADTSLQNQINGKQDSLTAGSNIQINNNTISATDTTYSAGAGLSLTGTTFSADTTVLATQTDLGDEATARQNADTALSNRVTTIESEIPSAASSSNQLADKNFVNSSIATNTSNYISDNGEPFDSLADLEAYSGPLTNNDYAFVIGTDEYGNTTYTRYKYNANTQTWSEEYVLNNSSFTSTQWNAINSGITSSDVTKLTNLANIKSIGSNLSLDANGQLSATDTTYTDMTGATSQAAGTSGLVPAPVAGDNTKYLSGDGTWKDVPVYTLPKASSSTLGGIKVGTDLSISSDGTLSAVNQRLTPVQTTGSSTTDVMSQKAVTDALSLKANTSSLATVATSGSYNDLSNKPTIPAAQIQSDWTQSDNTKLDFIKNKPSLATVATSGSYNDLSNTPSLATVATSGSYNDLSNKPTIPTVNNATLTIQKNGTNVQTFTANASSNKTANITVPTALSELTNDINAVSDSNYVHTDNNFTTTEKNKLAGIASGAEVNVQSDWSVTDTSSDAFIKNKPTIPTVNNGTLTIQKNGSSVATFTANQSGNSTANITVPTKTSDITNDSGYITKSVNNLDNYTTTTDMNTALGKKVNIANIDLTDQTTTILELTKALGTDGIHYARWYSQTDSGAANISDKPTGSTNASFVCEARCSRRNSSSDYTYQLTCWVQTDTNPYVASVRNNTTSISWSRLKPTVNNATLTIQKNGTTIDTFTANASSNKTVNITVPTIDNVIEIEKTLSGVTSWTNTGIAGPDLEEGTYIVQLNTNGNWGGLWSEKYSGIMSWHAANTNSSHYDEILLHHAGHADNTQNFYLRTKRDGETRNGTKYMSLQYAMNNTVDTTHTIKFKFRRLI